VGLGLRRKAFKILRRQRAFAFLGNLGFAANIAAFGAITPLFKN